MRQTQSWSIASASTGHSIQTKQRLCSRIVALPSGAWRVIFPAMINNDIARIRTTAKECALEWANQAHDESPTTWHSVIPAEDIIHVEARLQRPMTLAESCEFRDAFKAAYAEAMMKRES